MTLWVDPAPSIRTSTDFPRRPPGSWRSASVMTAMWSVAVFDPALPGRRRIARRSPVPAAPWSANAHNGWKPNPFLNVGRAFSFSVRGDQGGVDIDNHRMAGIGAVVWGVGPGRAPNPCPGGRAGPVDRRQDPVDIRRQAGDRARERRVRGDRAEPAVFGPVASDPTLSRTIARLAADVDRVLPAIDRARATARARVWGAAGTHAPDHGADARHPVVVDVDATLVTSHREGVVSYTHLRAHETDSYLVCRLLLEKK